MADFKPLNTFFQGALPAMGQAASQFAGYQDRPVSMGQMLGAMGGAGMQGQMQAQRYNQQGQMNNLNMQNIQQQMALAKAAEQRAIQQNIALQGIDPKYTGWSQAAILADMKNKQELQKYGTPQKVMNEDGTFEWQSTNQAGDVRSQGAAPPVNTMFDPNRYQKEARYKNAWDRYEKATAERADADQITGRVTQMMDLVDRVDSGSFADTKLTIRKALASVGITDFDSLNKISDAEAMKSQGMGFVLDLISKTKGAISEKEMDAFAAASAGIKNTPAGNKMILAFTQKIADRRAFVADKVREAYKDGITAVELDNVRFKAMKEFGSVIPERPKQGGLSGDTALVGDVMLPPAPEGFF